MPIAGHPPHIYGPAARCKWNLRMGMRSASIGLWLELAPPGHHGNPRAALLIRSKASKAMCGARLKLRRETVVPSSSSSREPRRDFNYLLFGSDDCYVALGASAVSYSRAL